jgi:tRNA1(Val) A37 N6-methylase TrmN6
MVSMTVARRPGYVYVRMGDTPPTREDAVEIENKVLEELRASGLKRLLTETGQVKRILRVEDLFAIAEGFAKKITGLRMAVVIDAALHTPEVAFFELASTSAGNILRYFSDFSQAEAWLQQP